MFSNDNIPNLIKFNTATSLMVITDYGVGTNAVMKL